MEEQRYHKELIDGVAAHYAEIFENSDQGMYIYLDGTHKVCNKKFSDMLGYKTLGLWAKNEDSFTDLFVEDNSAKDLVGAYAADMKSMLASRVKVTSNSFCQNV